MNTWHWIRVKTEFLALQFSSSRWTIILMMSAYWQKRFHSTMLHNSIVYLAAEFYILSNKVWTWWENVFGHPLVETISKDCGSCLNKDITAHFVSKPEGHYFNRWSQKCYRKRPKWYQPTVVMRQQSSWPGEVSGVWKERADQSWPVAAVGSIVLSLGI